ncbi:hypothetical protein [Methanobrevibacter arboriphilus]|uniref:hypothetical protein n=1 Tax=Methanobrevibacter arboriphilus TaxID=39441 RepID=UPI0006D1278A|nr:hypothetical protein [Methanobrevibacter arboriphilus]
MIFKEFNPNKHDTRKVAELIYSVDYRTNLKVFRSKERAVLAIETLLLSEKNNYNEKKSEDYIIDLNHHNNQKNIANINNDQKYNANNNSIKKQIIIISLIIIINIMIEKTIKISTIKV